MGMVYDVAMFTTQYVLIYPPLCMYPYVLPRPRKRNKSKVLDVVVSIDKQEYIRIMHHDDANEIIMMST